MSDLWTTIIQNWLPTLIPLLYVLIGAMFGAVLSAILTKTQIVSDFIYKRVKPPVELFSWYYLDGLGSLKYISVDGKPPPFIVGGPERLTISREGYSLGRAEYFWDILTIVNKSDIPIPITRLSLLMKPDPESGAFKELRDEATNQLITTEVDWQKNNWVGAVISIDNNDWSSIIKYAKKLQDAYFDVQQSRLQMGNSSIEIPLKFDSRSLGFVLKPNEARVFALIIVPMVSGMSISAEAKLNIKYPYKAIRELTYRTQWLPQEARRGE